MTPGSGRPSWARTRPVSRLRATGYGLGDVQRDRDRGHPVGGVRGDGERHRPVAGQGRAAGVQRDGDHGAPARTQRDPTDVLRQPRHVGLDGVVPGERLGDRLRLRAAGAGAAADPVHARRRTAPERRLRGRRQGKLGPRHAGKIFTVGIEDTHFRILHGEDELAVRPRKVVTRRVASLAELSEALDEAADPQGVTLMEVMLPVQDVPPLLAVLSQAIASANVAA
ncbi:hypothetical protein AB0D38_22375 [Streptomyces sp. NPDC048279]|uniref:hypothetical protein n=1 Tax=Streptomyces sp. NPDC048279 TaxID=3154714 RepID=UPI0034313679